MKTRTTLLALTALVAALILPLAAEAQQSGKGRSPAEILTHPRLLARYLKLTPEQTTTAQGLYRDLEAVVKPLREARKDLRDAYRAELEEANPNACDVGAAALALRANGDQIRAALEDFDEAFSAILTPEQLAKYEALKEAARLLRGDDSEDP
jgi:Spy/CpxP family protein refolding chaperone